MGNLFERGTEVARNERSILSLIDSTSAPDAEVRKLYACEYARLELNSKVHTHLQALTTSNVREMLRRLDATPQPAA